MPPLDTDQLALPVWQSGSKTLLGMWAGRKVSVQLLLMQDATWLALGTLYETHQTTRCRFVGSDEQDAYLGVLQALSEASEKE